MQHTELLQVDPIHPDPSALEFAATLLREGQLVVFPTETVYGLGGDAMQTQALESIFTAKGRPFSDPLIVHIADEDALTPLVTNIPMQVQRLAETFWPGPLTLILPASSRVPKLVTAGLATVAVRMPRHPVARALIRALGSPIAAPSANRFMHVSPTMAQHAFSDLNGRVPLILDSGPCEVGVESTVLDLCSSTPTILRPGGVSLEALLHVLPQLQHSSSSKDYKKSENDVQRSPGQLPIHYSPTVPTLLFDGPVQAMRAAILAEARRRQAQGERVGVLIADEDFATFADSEASIYTLGSAMQPEQVATRLFAGLRVLEEAGVQVILCRNFSEQGLGLAIRDRLLKAAGGNVINVAQG